jgi:hypothetical protein
MFNCKIYRRLEPRFASVSRCGARDNNGCPLEFSDLERQSGYNNDVQAFDGRTGDGRSQEAVRYQSCRATTGGTKNRGNHVGSLTVRFWKRWRGRNRQNLDNRASLTFTEVFAAVSVKLTGAEFFWVCCCSTSWVVAVQL